VLSVVLSIILSLSAICSGTGTAKADSVIATIPVGSSLFAIAFDSDNGNLYVTSQNDGTVSVISGQTNQVLGTPITVGKNPIGIAFDSANGNLYVANQADNTVSLISDVTPPSRTTITSAINSIYSYARF
jgi:YVTN family beta-propeller protein